METTTNLTTQHHIQLRATKKKVKKLTSQNFEAYFKYLESTYKSKYLKRKYLTSIIWLNECMKGKNG
jgi:hypothetical protein